MEEKDQSSNQLATAPVVDGVQPPARDEEPSLASEPSGNTDLGLEPAPAVDGSSQADMAPPIQPSSQVMTAKKRKSPALTIVIAVIVLAALGVVAFMAFGKKDNPTQTNQTTQQPTESVNAKTVDDTTKEVDDAVDSVNEAEDFADNDLTDQTLGL